VPFAPGTVVAGYRIERILGAGGMGTVYLVQHPSLPRRDALKVLSAELSHDEQFRARFLREAELAAALDHPNIVTVYDRGETPEGQLWIAMQFVDGTDASSEVAESKMTAIRAVHIVTEVAKALDYAHSRNLLHRDVKPANFLLAGPVGYQERVMLADFGIARALDDATNLTATGSVVATASYAAPESVLGRRLDPRADVYSLGCSLFRLLTRRTPYAEFTGMSAMLMAHVYQPIPRATQFVPWLPPVVNEVFVHALAKDPELRYQSAGALAAAAVAAMGGEAPVAPAPGAGETRGWRTPAPLPQQPTIPPPIMPPGGPPFGGPGAPPGWGLPPPRRRTRRWWVVGGAAAAAVAVAVAVVVTASHTGGHPAAGPTGSGSGPASSPSTITLPTLQAFSANDNGPVMIITVDPDCDTWQGLGQEWTGEPLLTKWDPKSPESPINNPASSWTPEQRAVMDRAGTLLRAISKKAEPLAGQTPHRVQRELYEQFIAYARAYANSLANYYPQEDVKLGRAQQAAFNALVGTCNAIADGAADSRAGQLVPGPKPVRVAPPQDPANPQRFIGAPDKATCGEWAAVIDKYNANPTVQGWDKADQKIPADKWTPQQKALADALAPLLIGLADDLERTAGRSNNPTIQDFAAYAAQYQRAYANALPTNTPHDFQLGLAAKSARSLVYEACSAVGA
jgi:serine/threonine protein kinase